MRNRNEYAGVGWSGLRKTHLNAARIIMVLGALLFIVFFAVSIFKHFHA